jgi:molybdopterin-guanine dinucleotide biosynthesis protein A
MLEYLLANSENYDITIPVHDENFMEPLCGIYKKSSIGILKQFIDEGNFRMMECIRHANSMLVPMGPELSFFSPGLFLNVNTPADFKKLLSIFGNGGSTKLADPL